MLRRANTLLILAVTTFVFPTEGQASSLKKKFIVQVRGPKAAMSAYTTIVRGLNTSAVRLELDENVVGVRTKHSLPNLGMLIVEADDEESLKQALARSPYNYRIEADVEWRPAALSDTPSGQELSPWLNRVLDLDANDPDAELAYVGSSPVLVAVIDTGASLQHPYLLNAWARNEAEIDGSPDTDDDGNGYVDDEYGANVFYKNGDVSEDNTDHGTHVAGLVKTVRDQAIAYEDGGYPYDAARQVQILPIRFINETGVGSTSGAILALEYAASRGAKVLNASWGARGEAAFSQAMYDAMVELYVKKDMMITVAAGNAEPGIGPNNNDRVPYFPSSFAIPSLLSVASVTAEFIYSGSGTKLQRLPLSSFSNYGSEAVHIAAPGGYKDADGDDDGVYSANANFSSGGESYYVRKQGTSMAAPVVAGVAAVVRALNPSLTAYEVRKVILDSATQKSNLSSVVSSGAVVNAVAAFELALNTVTKGKKPKVPSEPYSVSSAPVTQTASSTEQSDSGGGCGAVVPQNGSGPWGGNSMGLLALAYALMAFARRATRMSGARKKNQQNLG